MKLVVPAAVYEQSYREYITELADEERYPFPLDFEHNDFEQLLTRLNDFAEGCNLPDGYVQSSTLWLVDDEQIVGVTNIRHRLNNAIRHCGGHIGLGIRPSYRGKGIGKQLMQMSIHYLAQMNVSSIHIHCHKHNLASANMIKACAGILDSEITQAGLVVQRFVVIPISIRS